MRLDVYEGEVNNSYEKKVNMTIIILAILFVICISGVILKVFGSNDDSKVDAGSNEYIYNIDYRAKANLPVYSVSDIDKDFETRNYFNGTERMSITDMGLAFNMPAKQVEYESSGGRIGYKLPAAYEYTIEYSVYFESNESDYDWGGGGVLGGLSAATYQDGVKINKYYGYVVFLTWDYCGTICPRLYTYEDTENNGTEIETNASFKTNQWQTVKMYVKSNGSYNNNGVLKIWLDDEEIYSCDTMSFSRKSTPIDAGILQAYHSSYYGIAPESDQTVYIGSYKQYTSNCMDMPEAAQTSDVTATEEPEPTDDAIIEILGTAVPPSEAPDNNDSNNTTPGATNTPATTAASKTEAPKATNATATTAPNTVTTQKPTEESEPTTNPVQTPAVVTTETPVVTEAPTVAPTPTPTPVPTPTPNPGELSVSFAKHGTGSDWGSWTYYKGSITLKNTTAKDISDWTLYLKRDQFNFRTFDGNLRKNGWEYYKISGGSSYVVKAGESLTINFTSWNDFSTSPTMKLEY